MTKKKRIPRQLKIPIMRSTVDAFAQELHFGILAARCGSFNDKNFQRIARVINLCSVALYGKEVDRGVEAAIDGAIRTMNEIDEKVKVHGTWRINDFQILSLCAGIQKIEEILPSLSITELRNAQIKLGMMK